MSSAAESYERFVARDYRGPCRGNDALSTPSSNRTYGFPVYGSPTVPLSQGMHKELMACKP